MLSPIKCYICLSSSSLPHHPLFSLGHSPPTQARPCFSISNRSRLLLLLLPGIFLNKNPWHGFSNTGQMWAFVFRREIVDQPQWMSWQILWQTFPLKSDVILKLKKILVLMREGRGVRPRRNVFIFLHRRWKLVLSTWKKNHIDKRMWNLASCSTFLH